MILAGPDYSVDDLFFMKAAGIAIDTETFESVRHWENRNWSLAPCENCGAKKLHQHDFNCPHASVLWCDDWYEKINSWL